MWVIIWVNFHTLYIYTSYIGYIKACLKVFSNVFFFFTNYFFLINSKLYNRQVCETSNITIILLKKEKEKKSYSETICIKLYYFVRNGVAYLNDNDINH